MSGPRLNPERISFKLHSKDIDWFYLEEKYLTIYSELKLFTIVDAAVFFTL